MTEESAQKARGAFFTPPEISQFLVNWAVRASSDHVLEPSCGDAAFLIPAACRLKALGANQLARQLHGIDIHQPSALAAKGLLEGLGLTATVETGDFFDKVPNPNFDAVVGNPPFVRYQDFSGAARTKSLRAALSHGVRLSALASSWAAFTVHASEFLSDSGRLGLVLPAELLSVNYAAEVRRFLLGRFAKVRLVLFEQLVFPGVLEDVVLLLAEGRGTATHFEVYQTRDAKGLATLDTSLQQGFTPLENEKWTPALCTPEDADYRIKKDNVERDDALLRGAHVLLCSHLEGYFEDLVSDLIAAYDRLASHVSLLPDELRAQQVTGGSSKWGAKDPNKRWQTMQAWSAHPLIHYNAEKPIGCMEASLHIDGFSNPGSNEIELLFRTVGISDIWDLFRAVEPDRLIFQSVNAIVHRRNQIAHGNADATITLSDANLYVQRAERIAEVFEQLIFAEINYRLTFQDCWNALEQSLA